MNIKKIVKIFFIFLILTIMFFFVYDKFFKITKVVETPKKVEDIIYNSNIMENVNYASKDTDGNEYIISASLGEIDYSNPEVIYLTDVKALIKLKNSEKISIKSKYGKYNSENYDTIFSKNVIITYLDNEILGDYLDFSLDKNLMVISKNVIFSNLENILKADVIEINIKTKDTKIFMYENEKKVNIKNK